MRLIMIKESVDWRETKGNGEDERERTCGEVHVASHYPHHLQFHAVDYGLWMQMDMD